MSLTSTQHPICQWGRAAGMVHNCWDLEQHGRANQPPEEMPSRAGCPALPSQLSSAWWPVALGSYKITSSGSPGSGGFPCPGSWAQLWLSVLRVAQITGLSSPAGLQEPGNLCTEPGSDQNMPQSKNCQLTEMPEPPRLRAGSHGMKNVLSAVSLSWLRFHSLFFFLLPLRKLEIGAKEVIAHLNLSPSFFLLPLLNFLRVFPISPHTWFTLCFPHCFGVVLKTGWAQSCGFCWVCVAGLAALGLQELCEHPMPTWELGMLCPACLAPVAGCRGCTPAWNPPSIHPGMLSGPVPGGRPWTPVFCTHFCGTGIKAGAGMGWGVFDLRLWNRAELSML